MQQATEPTRRCRHCGEIKPIRGGFYESKSHQNYPVCRDCFSRKQIERVRHITEHINAYKMERGCADCGWREFPEALEFDHRPGVDKVAHVSLLRHKAPIEVVIAEMEKCDVVCANCHRRRTVQRGDAGNGKHHDLRKNRTGRFLLSETTLRLDPLTAPSVEPTLFSLLDETG